MENNYQGSNKIICPQITCGIILGIYILSFVVNLWTTNGLTLLFSLAIVVIYGIVFFLILKGIKERAYNYYNVGFLMSIILSSILTFFRIIAIIVIANTKTSSSSEEQQKINILTGNILGIFFDWIEACILMGYKNKVKNLCEPPYNPALDYQNSETNNAPFV